MRWRCTAMARSVAVILLPAPVEYSPPPKSSPMDDTEPPVRPTVDPPSMRTPKAFSPVTAIDALLAVTVDDPDAATPCATNPVVAIDPPVIFRVLPVYHAAPYADRQSDG